MVRAGLTLMAAGLLALASCEPAPTENALAEYETGRTENRHAMLWSATHLAVQLDMKEDILLLDMRKAGFEAGHIPTAQPIWRSDIQRSDLPFKGMAHNRDTLETLLSRLGAGPERQIVVYDDRGGCDAARVWWLLSLYGHEKVAILDGGTQAWTELVEEGKNSWEPGPPVPVSPTRYQFQAPGRSELLINGKEIAAVLNDSSVILLDTRSLEEFSGARQKSGAFRPGHIPGAVNYDWGNAVDMDSLHLIKSLKHIQWDLNQLGVTPDKRIVTYCHTGVRSAHTTFVLREMLGYPNVSNYDGSWCEWSYHEELPAATTTEPE